MKLLNCLKCTHIVSLDRDSTVVCKCGASRGRYLHDGLIALVHGDHVRVLGIANAQYRTSVHEPVIPFRTNYQWFPILPQVEHHVRQVATVDQFEQAIEDDRRAVLSLRYAAKCLTCNTVIASLYNHHFVTCPCGKLSVDGGGSGKCYGTIITHGSDARYEKVD